MTEPTEARQDGLAGIREKIAHLRYRSVLVFGGKREWL